MSEPSTPQRPPLSSGLSLASLATSFAGASRVFLRHGLDFCCNGQVSLETACERKGLDSAAILAELERELRPETPVEPWDQWPLPELIEHVLARFHASHRTELPRLIEMATRVERVHAAKSSCPKGLAAHLRFIADELENHMQKEEQILFPMLLAGHGAQAGGPIHVMEAEHQDHGRNLATLRQLAHDFVPPPEACGTWRALYLGLAELEAAVMQHIHLENHVLFPRALRS